MSSGTLPAEIDPFQLAAEGAVLEGEVSQANFDRLIPDPAARTRPVEIRLEFFPAENDAVLARGHVETEVPLICQRCMEPMTQRVVAQPEILFVRPQQATALTQQGIEVIAVEGRIDLRHLLEDELLLGLPMIPMHDRAVCPAAKHIKEQTGKTALEEGEERQQPFAGLKALLDSKRQD